MLKRCKHAVASRASKSKRKRKGKDENVSIVDRNNNGTDTIINISQTYPIYTCLSLLGLVKDVQLLIFSLLDLPTILSCQFVSRRIRELVNEANPSWRQPKRCPCIISFMRWDTIHGIIGARGYLKLLKFLHARGLLQWAPELSFQAARRGHLNVLKWVWRTWGELGDGVTDAAARNGDLVILKWLRAKGLRCGSAECYIAAEAGDLELLKWLFDTGCEVDSLVASIAGRHGHLHVLRWLYEKGFDRMWVDDASLSALAGGHMHVLEWALTTSVPLKDTTIIAIKRGDLRAVQILLAGGIKLAEIWRSAYFGHTSVVEWMLDNGAPTCYEIIVCAAKGNHLDTVRLLVTRGCPVDMDRFQRDFPEMYSLVYGDAVRQ